MLALMLVLAALPEARRVPVLIVDSGYEPSRVRAKPNERIDLVFTRYSKTACAEMVVVGGKTTAIPYDTTTVVSVDVPASGTLSFGCPSKRLLGAIDISDAPIDPGLEHPLVRRPLSLDHAKALIGKAAPGWDVAAWNGGKPLDLAALRGRVVVVRFYMDECPFCRASLPALQSLSEAFAGEPVTFVGLFHMKPPDAKADWPAAAATARRWGAKFQLGFDQEWKTLRAWYGDFVDRSPTSVTFILDRKGRFAFVHPGPVFHPSEHPDHARCNADYAQIKGAIAAALKR